MILFVTILQFTHIILSVFLIGSILLQQSGSGLGEAFGGSGGDSAFTTRRGSEKFLFNATIILGILFALSALLSFAIK